MLDFKDSILKLIQNKITSYHMSAADLTKVANDSTYYITVELE